MYCISNLINLFPFSTEDAVKKVTVEEMCPRFPEPVPLKHPIISLRLALEKVNLTHQHGNNVYWYYNEDILGIVILSLFLHTDRYTVEVKHSQNQAASNICHCGFKWLCSVEWKLWQEEHEWPLILCTEWIHGVQVRLNIICKFRREILISCSPKAAQLLHNISSSINLIIITTHDTT